MTVHPTAFETSDVSISNRPLTRPGLRPYVKFPRAIPASGPVPGPDEAKPWSVPGLCEAYGWPSGLTGGGVVAIVELGGGWTPRDVNLFCKVNNIPRPSITDVSVDGTRNAPGADADADGEVALDIQIAAAAYSTATGKPATIRVYWARDIAPAVRAAAKDGCDVCSISWGMDEAAWDAEAARDMERAAAGAASGGMIVLAAAGDNDSSDGGPTPANVDAPASCPHVIACGGTRKTAASETVWNNDPGKPSGEGTGGGISVLFRPMPPWQIGAAPASGRLVPDVAANADPDTGYEIVQNGDFVITGGTSAVAPLYAGLFAACGVKLGWIAPILWSNPLCFNDITAGDNGIFEASAGPDACTGLGAPVAARLAALLTGTAGRTAPAVRRAAPRS